MLPRGVRVSRAYPLEVIHPLEGRVSERQGELGTEGKGLGISAWHLGSCRRGDQVWCYAPCRHSVSREGLVLGPGGWGSSRPGVDLRPCGARSPEWYASPQWGYAPRLTPMGAREGVLATFGVTHHPGHAG